MNLVELRKQGRYTQEEIAAYLGVSRVTYSKLEHHPEELNYKTAKKLADFFGGVPVNYIFLPHNYN